MSSTITDYSNLINISYPIPGEDNDTQGFRDNFSRIQSALFVADTEISNIQLNAVNLGNTNDFGYNILKRPSFQNESVIVSDVGVVSGSTIIIDYALGSYQRYTLAGGDYLFVITNWPPAGRCGSIKLEITPSSSDTISLNFSGSVNILTKSSLPVSYSQINPIVWELWSPDNGTNIYAHEFGIPNALSVNGNNVFSAVNTFTQITTFQSLINLASLSLAEANALLDVQEGAIIYVSDAGKPAYYSSTGSWVTIG